jgi:hypothetical protein
MDEKGASKMTEIHDVAKGVVKAELSALSRANLDVVTAVAVVAAA